MQQRYALFQEVCYQYWPGKRVQSYGEFRVELLSEENRGGFLLRAFSVQQAKVIKIADINFCKLSLLLDTLVQHSASSVAVPSTRVGLRLPVC